MIGRLKQRFILIAMLSVLLVLTLLMTVINIFNYRQILKNADELLEILSENEGSFPGQREGIFHGGIGQGGVLDAPFLLKGEDLGETPAFSVPEGSAAFSEESGAFPESTGPVPEEFGQPQEDWLYRKNGRMNEETPFETRFFSVRYDEAGEVTKVGLDSIAAVDEETAVSYADKVREGSREVGFYGGYRYRMTEKEDGLLIVFLDAGRDLDAFRSFLRISILVSLLGCVGVFFLIWLFSSWILQPVAESYAKQKRFITDASHELKTPLTVIDANTEVMEMLQGENEWSESIHHQVKRLRSLTERLVALSRMDEENRKLVREAFSLSSAVSETVSGYEAALEQKGLSLEEKIEENLSFSGDETAIRELVAILMDNALKYADPSAPVTVRLERKGRGASLTVENAAPGMKKGEHPELLERFARSDLSRNSETGGFGIGLSMAQSIVLEHKGRIAVKSPEDDRFQITVWL